MNVDEVIFNLYKDIEIRAKYFRSDIRKKYKLNDIEISNIYAKINNYQMEKYGQKLERSDHIEFRTKEESRRISKIKNSTRYYNLQKRKGKI